MSDIQHEVAVHLLANALRKRRSGSQRIGERRGRRNPDDDYLRGMIDLLNALYGRDRTDELYRQALALERSASNR
ncbi:MAG: hypothetical protein IT336_15470 [Thermomicrobiales bacterium]|nr:hypothetical protein [Thermomicrobiales bacterium]